MRRCEDRGDRGWGDRPARVPGRAHADRCRGRSPDGEATAAGRVLATATQDDPVYVRAVEEHYGSRLGCRVEALTVVGRTQSFADFDRTIGSADIVYVGGGNTLRIMKLWRRRGVDRLLARAAADGTVMAGFSAGAICWCTAGLSDSHSFTSADGAWPYMAVRGLGLVDVLLCRTTTPTCGGGTRCNVLRRVDGSLVSVSRTAPRSR